MNVVKEFALNCLIGQIGVDEEAGGTQNTRSTSQLEKVKFEELIDNSLYRLLLLLLLFRYLVCDITSSSSFTSFGAKSPGESTKAHEAKLPPRREDREEILILEFEISI